MEVWILKYALLGDIHSSIHELKKVLAHISEISPTAKLIGTGDLFECTISKKDINDQKYNHLKDVMLLPEGFTEYLSFPSISGNQEERILLITKTDDELREKIALYPQTIQIDDALIIHGHQWKWGGEPWSLINDNSTHLLTFYGHSHQSALTIDNQKYVVEFGHPYDLSKIAGKVLVNVGSVVSNKEWVLYDSNNRTITFMKA